MIKNIFRWAMLFAFIGLFFGLLLGCDIKIANMPDYPAEYRLMCDTETKRAYVTYKHWSAHIPNADKFCQDETSSAAMKPIFLVM
jgi:hypothetical protein